jgi:hypothetical protein
MQQLIDDAGKVSRPAMGAVALWIVALMSMAGGMYVGHTLGISGTNPAFMISTGLSVPQQVAPPPEPFAFPVGGRTLASTYRLVALYGTPDEPALGALGEQPLPAAIDRVKGVARSYAPLSTSPVLPTFEIIATIASSSPTGNGDYSQEVDVAKLATWIQSAQANGVYVVLDLQPGRTDFLAQAKQYEALLKQPNVGLALDPEWRLGPDQVPLRQTGSVTIGEVNGVIGWLAQLTTSNHLPQKLFVLHQFRLDMLPGREQLDSSHPELAYIIQMDGQGEQVQKQNTWSAITAGPPANVAFGWKNFYQKDSPVLDPADTMQIVPQPWYISYQ